ncbi:MAG: hypothetical protein DRH50_02260 [Deltaproteobacteria bacterium]|nr:MAG: hypothetical protein DRH50_02260 [Deltaproteobacteria bacterium]
METITTDVLVIGAGAAGIRAALAASETGAEVTLLAKGGVGKSGASFSHLSGGWGIQALVGRERTNKQLEDFYDDIVRVGLGVCDTKLVRILVEESGPRLEDLIRYGIRLKKDPQGNYTRVKGCFSDYKRAFIAEDVGNIRQSLLSVIRGSAVKTMKGYALDLIIGDNACWGAWVLTEDAEIVEIKAGSTILATGGAAGVFMNHLVSSDEVGDGYALAHRAGAELNNLEFIQFILGLKKDERRLFLPLQDLKKPAAILDSDGRDLLEKHIPDSNIRSKAVDERGKHFPFSCRDDSCQVDIAVARERQKGKKVFWKEGNPMEQGAEVVHFSHAFNGGVKIGERGESSVPGLFAAGEVAAGPHGADRIGGCMMTATQVFGARAGRFAALRAMKVGATSPNIRIPGGIEEILSQRECQAQSKDLISVKERTREIFSRHLMCLRNKNGLEFCLSKIKEADLCLKQVKNVRGNLFLNARNTFLVMRLVASTALKREASLGSHYREARQ